MKIEDTAGLNELLLRLLDTADVFITNNPRMESLARSGLDESSPGPAVAADFHEVGVAVHVVQAAPAPAEDPGHKAADLDLKRAETSRPTPRTLTRGPENPRRSAPTLATAPVTNTAPSAAAVPDMEGAARRTLDGAELAGEMAVFFDMLPRVAMLSYSNFGSVRNQETQRVARAVALVREQKPDLVIDGEMQADTAVMDSILNADFAFNQLRKAANVLIFPSLASGNIAYKLMNRLGGARLVGPLLMGLNRPFNVLQRNSEVESVVDLIAITVVQAQMEKRPLKKQTQTA